MTTASLSTWTCLRHPGAHVEKGLVVCSIVGERYNPGEHQGRLLTSIQQVHNEEDAVSFVRQWGLLGFARAAQSTKLLSSSFESALGIAWIIWEEEGSGVKDDSLSGEVADWYEQPNIRKEPIHLIPKFAEYVRDLSEVVRILGFFREDAYAANYEAEQWVNSLSPERQRALEESSQEFHSVLRGLGSTEPYDSHYMLTTVLKTARFQFSDRSQRGIWVRVNPSNGRTGFEFDGLFRFIEYILLSDNVPSSRRCKDPKCGHLFFPIRSNARYCPSPVSGKRSLCEQRHYQEIKRASKNAKDSSTD